jgi:ABC-type branched-subunit amino acid transport system ATPase component
MSERSRPDLTPALHVEDLQVRFGGVVAVAGLTFTVPRGQLLGVIGANGAGKTTMFDAVCGSIAHSGRVLVCGRDVSHLPPSLRARAGIGRSFQDARLFPALSVRDTVAMALQRDAEDPGMTAELLGWPSARRGDKALRARADEVIGVFGLEQWADSFIADLSTGTRRVVDLACVHALHPEVILLDEPASGIAQREVEALADVILRLRELSDATVLVVEHDVPLVRRVAERVLVMEAGRLIADGAPDEVLELPEVIAAYLGTDQGALRRSGAALPAAAALVEVAAEDGSNDAVEQIAVPGLPERDGFRIPLRLTGGGSLAAAAAVLLAAMVGTAGAPPAGRAVANHAPTHVAAPATATPAPAAPHPAAPVAALPPVTPTLPALPLTPVDSLDFSTLPLAAPSNPPDDTPPPTPTPNPCPVDQLAPVCDLVAGLPVTVPLPAAPAAAGMAWTKAGAGPWVQVPQGWRVAAWGAAPRRAPSAQQGTLIAWTGGSATDPRLGELSLTWWPSTAVLRAQSVQGPYTLPGGQREWLLVHCDGIRCLLTIAVGGAADTVDAQQVEAMESSVR